MLEVKENNVIYFFECPSYDELQQAYAYYKKERERHRVKSKRQYDMRRQQKKENKPDIQIES